MDRGTKTTLLGFGKDHKETFGYFRGQGCGNIIVAAGTTTLLRVGHLYHHGCCNKHVIKVMQPSWPLTHRQKQQSPVLRSFVRDAP